MKAESRKDKTEALMQILRRIDQGDDPRTLRAEARRLIEQITPRDLARAEEILVRGGASSHQAGQLP